jgi:Mn2+/Fe2+ NRAMP family transporter
MGQQKSDANMAAVLVYVISGAIMAVAHGALYVNGDVVDNVLDMSKPLEPIAGKFAVSIFFFGTLSAGLSSIFPCLLIAPLLLADYQSGELDTKSTQFRVITLVACFAAMIGPILGAKPIQVQILSQVFNVFALPAVVLGIIILVNSKDLMKGHSIGGFVKFGLWTAFIFSLILSGTGVLGLLGY